MKARQIQETIVDAYPLTQLQMGMIFHSEFHPDSMAYHDIHSFRVQAPFDEQAISQAAQLVSNRHPVLRTRFDLTGFSEPLQLVVREVEVPVAFEDLRHLSADEQGERVAAYMQEEKRHRFDWRQAPLFRLKVHRRGEQEIQVTVTFHHAILDGWSLASMLTEMFQLYMKILRQDPQPLEPPPRVGFKDYVALELKALSAADGFEFWVKRLEGAKATRLSRRTAAAYEQEARDVQRHQMAIGPEVTRELQALALLAAVPIKSVLLAAHLRVLSVLSGEADVMTGLVTNTRPEEKDGERVLGLFLNTMPFRQRLGGGTWLELIKEAFRQERELQPRRWYPLSEVQRLIDGQPLFETAFNFIHFHVYEGARNIPGVGFIDSDSIEATNFTLLTNFIMSIEQSQMWIRLEYDANEFSASEVERLADYYYRTLQAMAAHPGGSYVGQPGLSAAEIELMARVNDTAADYTADGSLVAMVARQVAQQADAVAVVYGQAQVSYGALNEAADRLAAQLLAAPPAGVQRPGAAAAAATAAAAVTEVAEAAPVAICCGRGLNMAVAVLGVLKAGLPYLPIEASLPAARQLLMCRDAGVAVLIGEAGVAEGLREAGLHRLELNQSGQVIAASQKLSEEDAASRTPAAETVAATCGSLTVAPPEQALGYVIYTSGSTGQPKGIGLPLAALTNLISWHLRALPGRRRWLQFASLGFDASFHEMLACWASGGSLFILDPETRLDGERLAGYIAEREIERAILPVVVLQQLAEALAGQGEAGRTLREVITTGEAMQITRAVEELFARQEWSQLVNHYGPSETHVVTSYELEGEPSEWERQPSIGRAIANTQVYVLDEEKEAVAVGVAGELYIGGVMVGRGYVGRADLTAARFVPAVGGEAGGRMYATGDVVRQDEKGRLRYEGRRDEQVKVRGNRVEMGEVEAALVRRRGVKEAVVVARGEGMEKRLVGYVVWESEEGEGEVEREARVREELRQELPEYMVPGMVVGLERLPLTRNGKVDKRALPEVEATVVRSRREYVAPRTPAEELVAGVIAETLKIGQVGVEDNFFNLGGHSLLATQVVVRLREAFRVDLKLLGFFERPTVEGLVRMITQAWGDREVVEEIAATLMAVEAISEEEVRQMLTSQKVEATAKEV